MKYVPIPGYTYKNASARMSKAQDIVVSIDGIICIYYLPPPSIVHHHRFTQTPSLVTTLFVNPTSPMYKPHPSLYPPSLPPFWLTPPTPISYFASVYSPLLVKLIPLLVLNLLLDPHILLNNPISFTSLFINPTPFMHIQALYYSPHLPMSPVQ